MQYTIEELYNKVFSKVFEVYDIFKEFFGEEYVDLQGIISLEGFSSHYTFPWEKEPTTIDIVNTRQIENIQSHFNPFILVYWPSVTVTNEFGKSVSIQDLFAKVPVTFDGTIPYEEHGFTLNRSTYTMVQYTSNYLHSHIPRIPKDDFTIFMPPCLGTGPIRDTINSLKNEYDEFTWMLFCQELNLYVTVESISGVPYHRLETIGQNNYKIHASPFTLSRLYNFRSIGVCDFVKYYLENGNLKINYINGHYTLGFSMYDYIIDISNAFIDYYNKYVDHTETNLDTLYSNYVIYKVVVSNRKFYKIDHRNQVDTNVLGKLVCIFKGEEKKLKIIDYKSEEVSSVTILNPGIANMLARYIFLILNVRYNERNNISQEGDNTHRKYLYV